MSKVVSEISLLNLTLKNPSAINCAVFGNFSRPKIQEIVVSHGRSLSLLRPDDQAGKVVTVLTTEVFGVIRALIAFRLVGGNRDYIVTGTDSGRINILQYNPDKNRFDKVHEETFGKSGCRRIVPGQYLAVDPKGRAVMIGAIEKQKLVYVLNRDSAANLTISSPLEAHKSHTFNYSMVGVDVGFENPVFACLEADYEGDEETKEGSAVGLAPKALTYYELDLGLNHVTRKWTEKTDPTANLLITVPGGADGPGGVLVCAENAISYMNQDHKTLTVPLPRRFGLADEQGILIIQSATHVQKGFFFVLVQSEYGDVYKISLEYNAEEEEVTDIVIKYFDTVPPATSLCMLKTGFLFCASESANHYLFQFTSIGDDDDTPFTSYKMVEAQRQEEGAEEAMTVYFSPRRPTNLALIDEIDNLGPITDLKIMDLTKEHTPQIYALCGQGPRSSLRVLRHGLAVSDLAESALPGGPSAVWAIKTNASDEHMKYIVVSFVNATIVLSIGDTVSEVSDSGVLDSTPTLSMSLLGESSLLQIHPNGLRVIHADKRINEWKTPGKKSIMKCAVNGRQVAIALTGGELVYFELGIGSTLNELGRKDMGNDVASLAIGPIPEGRQRSQFMVVGGFDNTIRVLSLDPAQLLHQQTLQALPAQPTSLAILHMPSGVQDRLQTFLFIGLANGVLQRCILDETNGQLVDPRKRFLGTRAVKLSEVMVQGNKALIAMSSRPWLCYTYQSRQHTTPLSYEMLEDAAPFISEQCPEGVVCISGKTLRIMTLDKLGELFNQSSLPLRYTPRKCVADPLSNNLIIIETDQNAYPYKEKKELTAALQEDEDMEAPETKEDGEPMTEEEKQQAREQKEALTDSFMGTPQAGSGKWASCIRIVSPVEGKTLSIAELDDNEAAFSCALVNFGEGRDRKGDELFLAVGTVKDLRLAPRSFTAGYIRLYRFNRERSAVELMHKTDVGDVCLAMIPFQQKLLAGVGKNLRIYELGRTKLLKKSENKSFPTSISTLHAMGDRIYVGDMCEAIHMVSYKKADKQLHIFADNVSPRYMTASCLLDYDTVAGADKFGNIFISRLTSELSAKIDKDPTGGRMAAKYGLSLNGAPYKLTDICQFHVGDMVTSLNKVALVPGGEEVLCYSTITGAIGIMLPFSAREDVEFFGHLEMHMRQEAPPLCGRDHLAYRSYYFPVKDCVDGDLCEQFSSLESDRQQAIATELVSTPSEVAKKLEEQRNRVL